MRTYVCLAALVAAVALAAGRSPLADAAANEDWAQVRSLLAQHASVNTPQIDGATALLWAAHFDQFEILQVLLAAGADATAANRYGITPLSEACVNGDAPMIEALLQAGADPNRSTMEGETPLMTAARTGNPRALGALLAHSAAVNAAEKWRGQTPLMWAAAEGHPEAVQVLLAHGADIDANSGVFDFTGLRPQAGSVGMSLSRGGFTPLLFAARQGHLDTVRTLVEAHAGLNLPDPDGATPLLIAIINFHYDVAGYLIDQGADVNAADGKGRTPLYAAVDVKNLDVSTRLSPKIENRLDALGVIRKLLDHHAAVNAALTQTIPPRGVLDGADGTLGTGSTPFLRAARSSDLETMSLLLEHGANPRAATSDGVTALHLAAGFGWRAGKTRAVEADSVTAVRWMKGMGLDLMATTHHSGETPLHGAAARGANQVIQALVELGADVNARDNTNRTPLDVANGWGATPAGVHAPQESTAALLTRLGGVTGQR